MYALSASWPIPRLGQEKVFVRVEGNRPARGQVIQACAESRASLALSRGTAMSINDILTRAEAVGALLKQHGQTVAVAESSAGGLISAVLLAVPGASAYFKAGGVVYT